MSELVKQYTDNLQTIYGNNYLYDGFEFADQDEFKAFWDEKQVRIAKAKLRLETDKIANPKDLPVQLASDNIIILDSSTRKSYYDGIFNADFQLKTVDTTNTGRFLIVNNGFLGVKVFKGNCAIFNPRPYTLVRPSVPMFPGYSPIYYNLTKDDLLEHIYTTEYPNADIPVFPNFRVGDYVVDGRKYNPMYDVRNYRIQGTYVNVNSRSTRVGVFASSDMRTYSAAFKVSSIFKRADGNIYRVDTDFYNKTPLFVDYDGFRYLKVIGSGIKFVKLDSNIRNYQPFYNSLSL